MRQYIHGLYVYTYSKDMLCKYTEKKLRLFALAPKVLNIVLCVCVETVVEHYANTIA